MTSRSKILAHFNFTPTLYVRKYNFIDNSVSASHSSTSLLRRLAQYLFSHAAENYLVNDTRIIYAHSHCFLDYPSCHLHKYKTSHSKCLKDKIFYRKETTLYTICGFQTVKITVCLSWFHNLKKNMILIKLLKKVTKFLKISCEFIVKRISFKYI